MLELWGARVLPVDTCGSSNASTHGLYFVFACLRVFLLFWNENLILCQEILPHSVDGLVDRHRQSSYRIALVEIKQADHECAANIFKHLNCVDWSVALAILVVALGVEPVLGICDGQLGLCLPRLDIQLLRNVVDAPATGIVAL